jgi:2'-5' RNA ligase
VETIRAFIAIELPAELRKQLAQLQKMLKTDNQPPIKWVKPDGMHLTLKFLGNIPTSDIDRITAAMTNAVKQIPPFYLQTESLGAFPNLKRVQVVWVGLGGEVDKLKRLQQILETCLAQLGFAAEQRRFKPHLTLARLGREVSPSGRQDFGKLISATGLETSDRIRVNSIILIRSQLTKAGAIYTRISSAILPQEL